MDYPLNPTFPLMQNDDWAYYYSLENFLNGNFRLHELSGASFYVQGIIAYVFSVIFGVQNIPYLTVGISILCVVIFYSILRTIIGLNKTPTVLLTLLFALNPLFIYSSIGFMSENYLLLFILLSVKYFLTYLKNGKKNHLYLSLIYSVLSFGVKQTGIFIPIGYTVYFFIKKRYKDALISLICLILTLGFYEFLFPKTPVMMQKGQALVDLPAITNILSNSYLLIIYICAILAPGILAIFIPRVSMYLKFNKDLLIKSGVSIVLGLLYLSIKPDVVGFLFFDNTFHHKGFFPAEILGDKYVLKGFDDIFQLFEWLGVASLILLILNFDIRNIKFESFLEKLDPLLILIIVYSGIIITADSFFDRYILSLVPLSIIFISKFIDNNFKYLSVGFLSLGLILIGFISYNFSLDFIIANKYVWRNSIELATKDNLQSNQIGGNRAWTIYFEGIQGINPNKVYRFAYDDEIEGYTRIHERTINFPGNFFIEPKVYLHKLNTYEEKQFTPTLY